MWSRVSGTSSDHYSVWFSGTQRRRCIPLLDQDGCCCWGSSLGKEPTRSWWCAQLSVCRSHSSCKPFGLLLGNMTDFFLWLTIVFLIFPLEVKLLWRWFPSDLIQMKIAAQVHEYPAVCDFDGKIYPCRNGQGDQGKTFPLLSQEKALCFFQNFLSPQRYPLWTVVCVTLQSNLLDWPGSKLFICFNNALEWPAAIVVEGLSHSSTGILSLHCLIQWSSLIIQLPHTVPSKLQIHWKWVLSINSVWLIILSEKIKKHFIAYLEFKFHRVFSIFNYRV